MSTPSSDALTVLTVLAVAAPAAGAQAPDPALVAKARAIHERVITLDTHNDIDPRELHQGAQLHPAARQPGEPAEDGGRRARRRRSSSSSSGQGPLTQDGYDKAYAQAVEKFDAVHRLTKEIAPESHRPGAHGRRRAIDRRTRAARWRSSASRTRIRSAPNLARIKEFHDRGGRYMSLAHNGHSQFADSNTGERDGKWLHNGLSELGKQAIAEMNRWGMMVDVSHPVETGQPAGDRAVEGAGHRVALGGRARWPTTAATSTTSSCRRSRRTAASSRPWRSTAT